MNPGTVDVGAAARLAAELWRERAGGRRADFAPPMLTVTVCGDSMLPLLAPGDRVVITARSAAALRPGDIVLVSGPPPFLHRYIFRRGRRCFTKGDATRAIDPPWDEERLIGCAIWRRRGAHVMRLDGARSRAYGVLLALVLGMRHAWAGIRRRVARKIGTTARRATP